MDSIGTPEEDHHSNPGMTADENVEDDNTVYHDVEDDKYNCNISEGIESEREEIPDDEEYRIPNRGVRHPEDMSPLVQHVYNFRG